MTFAGSLAACTAPSSARSAAARFSAATTGALGGESGASAPLFSTGAAKRGLLRGGGVLATPCHGRAGLPSSPSTAIITSRGAAGVDCLVNQGGEVPLDLTQIVAIGRGLALAKRTSRAERAGGMRVPGRSRDKQG